MDAFNILCAKCFKNHVITTLFNYGTTIVDSHHNEVMGMGNPQQMNGACEEVRNSNKVYIANENDRPEWIIQTALVINTYVKLKCPRCHSNVGRIENLRAGATCVGGVGRPPVVQLTKNKIRMN